MRRVAWALGLVVVLLAGCASPASETSTTAEEDQARSTAAGAAATDVAGGFAGAFGHVTRQFRTRSEDLQARLGTSPLEADEVVLLYGELRDIAQLARQEYGELAPPAPVQTAHQHILQLFDRQVTLLDRVIESARSDDQSELTQAVQGLVDLTDDFDQARQRMEQAIRSCGAPCTT